jgi:hypothetical protein
LARDTRALDMAVVATALDTEAVVTALDTEVITALDTAVVATIVRGGDSNAPPKDGVVTASRAFVEGWAEGWPEEGWANLALPDFNNPASSSSRGLGSDRPLEFHANNNLNSPRLREMWRPTGRGSVAIGFAKKSPCFSGLSML